MRSFKLRLEDNKIIFFDGAYGALIQRMDLPRDIWGDYAGCTEYINLADPDTVVCNAGIMGFKEEFHQLSIKIASRLIAKIKSMNPGVLVTDCLSCRMQFNHLTHYKVLHPIQIIKESYSNYQE